MRNVLQLTHLDKEYIHMYRLSDRCTLKALKVRGGGGGMGGGLFKRIGYIYMYVCIYMYMYIYVYI